jgi:hypothetical protein
MQGVDPDVVQQLYRPLADTRQSTADPAPPAPSLPDPPEPWPQLAPEALVGLPGRVVETIRPYTEADDIAVLTHLLVAAGNLIGAGPHARVQHDRHWVRLFAVLVGRTAKARKGSAWSTPRYCLAALDRAWAAGRICSGLSSGEGVIYHVRDARQERQPIRGKGGRVEDYQFVDVDPGEADKRLLIIEPEFASVLRRMEQQTSSLSAVLRQAWESDALGTLTKNAPLRASGAHVSVVAHITQEETQRYLTATEQTNGFANRFLWLLTRRARTLPRGGAVPDELLVPIIDELAAALERARTVGVVARDEESEALWARVYPALSEGEEGLVGGIIARAEAQVVRLSVLYALLDQSSVVRVRHLDAALALWDYADRSARLIFGGRLGIPLADVILRELHARGRMTRTEISELFGRNRAASALAHALAVLESRSLARRRLEPTGGRPVEIWEPTPRTKETKEGGKGGAP